MQTIGEFLKKYVTDIFTKIGLGDEVTEESVNEIVDVILRESIAALLEEQLGEQKAQDYIKEIEAAEDKAEKIQTLIKNIGEESVVKEKILETANQLIFNFLVTLKEDGTLTDEAILKLKEYLESLK